MTTSYQPVKNSDYDEELLGQTEEQAARELDYLNELDLRVECAKKMYPEEYEQYKRSEIRRARQILLDATEI